MYDIKTIEDLVALLGGDTVVADWLGISQGAVGNWKQRQFIPPGWHMRLLAETRRRGKTIDPEVFGMNAMDWAAIFGSADPEPVHAHSL